MARPGAFPGENLRHVRLTEESDLRGLVAGTGSAFDQVALIVADGGAYCHTANKILGNATVTCAGPYEIPNVKADVDGVYTNDPPSGAFRGFGAPQAIFAAEMQMNKLAEALGMDPVELRLKNLLRETSLTAVGTPRPGGG